MITTQVFYTFPSFQGNPASISTQGQLYAPSGAPIIPQKGPSLREAINTLIASKEQSSLSKRYLQSLRNYLNQFMAFIGPDVSITDVSFSQVEKWLLSRNSEAPATMGSNRGRLSALFSFSVRRQWRTENPIMRLERVRITAKAPVILTPAQCRKLLEYCHDKRKAALAYITLCLVGCRPEEVCKLTWADISEDCKRVTLDSHVTKTRKRRIMDVPPNLQLWLRKARQFKSTLPLSRTTKRRYLYSFSVALGFDEWPQDCLRHSAASYLVAKTGDIFKTATQLGNSPGVITKNYLSLVTKETAEEFYSIRPPFEVVFEKAA